MGLCGLYVLWTPYFRLQKKKLLFSFIAPRLNLWLFFAVFRICKYCSRYIYDRENERIISILSNWGVFCWWCFFGPPDRRCWRPPLQWRPSSGRRPEDCRRDLAEGVRAVRRRPRVSATPHPGCPCARSWSRRRTLASSRSAAPCPGTRARYGPRSICCWTSGKPGSVSMPAGRSARISVEGCCLESTMELMLHCQFKLLVRFNRIETVVRFVFDRNADVQRLRLNDPFTWPNRALIKGFSIIIIQSGFGK